MVTEEELTACVARFGQLFTSFPGDAKDENAGPHEARGWVLLVALHTLAALLRCRLAIANGQDVENIAVVPSLLTVLTLLTNEHRTRLHKFFSYGMVRSLTRSINEPPKDLAAWLESSSEWLQAASSLVYTSESVKQLGFMARDEARLWRESRNWLLGQREPSPEHPPDPMCMEN